MKYPVYSIKDVKVGFIMPQCDQNDPSAVRGFVYGLKGSDNIMKFNPSDFELYKIGEFDTETGVLNGFKVPKLIASGSSYIEDIKE